ncbi:MAG: hypothetical protein K6E34_04645 [Lachnospiraceae bacterium]|nr:hypothetical protein [Lachnospiraceae bacterium]
MSKVIKIQQSAINELFQLLMQHISAEEADSLPVVKEINHAAGIMAEIGGLSE